MNSIVLLNGALLAYIDPGTGAILLQMIIAAVVGAGIYFRKFIAKILSTLGLAKKAEDPKNEKPS